jgi:hypothetical protein
MTMRTRTRQDSKRELVHLMLAGRLNTYIKRLAMSIHERRPAARH